MHKAKLASQDDFVAMVQERNNTIIAFLIANTTSAITADVSRRGDDPARWPRPKAEWNSPPHLITTEYSAVVLVDGRMPCTFAPGVFCRRKRVAEGRCLPLARPSSPHPRPFRSNASGTQQQHNCRYGREQNKRICGDPLSGW